MDIVKQRLLQYAKIQNIAMMEFYKKNFHIAIKF